MFLIIIFFRAQFTSYSVSTFELDLCLAQIEVQII